MAKSKRLTKNFLLKLGIPLIFIPGLILASVLGWNWQKNLARLAAQGGFYQNEQIFPKKAVVEEVIDGDTLNLEDKMTVRLIGIDTPDRGADFYEQALDFTIDFCQGKTVALEYDRYQDDKFGRILAYIWKDNKMLNLELIEKGLAKLVIYEKRGKLKYQDEFLEAQNRARNKKIGIWQEQ